MELYVDGGVHQYRDDRPNKGYGTWRIKAKPNLYDLVQGSEKFGECSCNEAEYRALIAGLLVLKKEGTPDERIEVYTDSQTVEGQINKGFRCQEELVSFRNKAIALIELLGVELIKKDKKDIEAVLGH